ncbi:hypothetical protein BH23BAC4_BH23BAC4_16580 [soil metagenome]
MQNNVDSFPKDAVDDRLHEALQDFIHLWGEMATHWGINRTMAQIHALLYASEQPLDTDVIMDRLQISRGNANTNLRLLAEWDLVQKTQQLGSRKDFYTAEKDVWKISTIIIEQRRRRELQPVRQALEECADRVRSGGQLTAEERAFAYRIDSLVEFLSVFEGFTSALVPFLRDRNASQIRRLTQLAGKLRREES